MPSGTTGDVGRVEANAERSTSGGWSSHWSRPGRRSGLGRSAPGALCFSPLVTQSCSASSDVRRVWEADVDAFSSTTTDFVEQTDGGLGRRFGDEAAAWRRSVEGRVAIGEDVVGHGAHPSWPRVKRRGLGRRRAWTAGDRRHGVDWRRRGVASALITASLRQLAETGGSTKRPSWRLDVDAAVSGRFAPRTTRSATARSSATP